MLERERGVGMKLYHASSVVVDTPDVLHSRANLDFGKGFYLTSLREQAVKYAYRFLFRGKEAYINEYLLDEDLSDARVKRFGRYDGEWLDFVGSCRKGISHNEFDVIEGGIANDKVFNTIDLYFSGTMSRDDALGRLAFIHPNHQLCITSQEVITKHLHFVGAEKITRKEEHDGGR